MYLHKSNFVVIEGLFHQIRKSFSFLFKFLQLHSVFPYLEAFRLESLLTEVMLFK